MKVHNTFDSLYCTWVCKAWVVNSGAIFLKFQVITAMNKLG